MSIEPIALQRKVTALASKVLKLENVVSGVNSNFEVLKYTSRLCVLEWFCWEALKVKREDEESLAISPISRLLRSPLLNWLLPVL